jgi:hypothetical protein
MLRGQPVEVDFHFSDNCAIMEAASATHDNMDKELKLPT